MSGGEKWTAGPWGDGNEAICIKIERERPWAGTVFRKEHDGSEANALIGMTFAATPEEAAANARLVGAAPDLYTAMHDYCTRYLQDEYENPEFCGVDPAQHKLIVAMFDALTRARGEVRP